MMRIYSPLDTLLSNVDRALKTLFCPPISKRAPQGKDLPNDTDTLTEGDRERSIRLMRVNHSGEIAAQALYQGQSLTAKNPEIQNKLLHAAEEEYDHLYWCQMRIQELGGHPSYLNPFWYSGSFAIGAIAGLFGDAFNLGFLAETEHQVVEHLDRHLTRLPQADFSSKVILEQMKIDEAAHATTAIDLGAQALPEPVRMMMRFSSKVMTSLAYFV